MLFFVSALSVIATIFILARAFAKRVDPITLALMLTGLCLYPSLIFRLFHSFVPEVLALPFYAMIVLRMRDTRNNLAISIFFVLAGLAKENLWLVNSWCLLVIASQRMGRPRIIFCTQALAHAALFVWLFTHWMPQHSNLPSYYGLQYYGLSSDQTVMEKITTLVGNVFSGRALETLFFLIFILTAGLIIRSDLVMLSGALPTLFLIGAATFGNVHHVANHYMLPALAFLWVAILSGIAKREHRLFRIMAFAVVAINLYVTFDHAAPLIANLLRSKEALATGYDDLKKISLTESSYVLIDANLQPLRPDIRHAVTILNFTANPRQLESEDFAKATDVITMGDIRSLTNCRDVVPGDDRGTVYNYDAFYRYCEWMKSGNFEVNAFESGIYHFKRL
jgi:hypothetical protein